MPFRESALMPPVFVTPRGDRRDHKPPVVSIKRAEDAVESGIRLHHNQRKEGYLLQPEVEGLGVAPVELQTAPLASGGSVARHSRLTEGDVFLPITLVSPVPSALPGMFDALVEIVRPGQRDDDGLPYQFEVVVFDPYGQETRSRRLIFESGLGDPVRVNHHVWRTSITGRFVDPFWYGQVRELRRTLGSVDKKFITAKQGPPDPDSPPSVTYEWEGERHASPSVKKIGGQVVAQNIFPDPQAANLSDWLNSSGVTDFSTVDRGDLFPWLPEFGTVARFRSSAGSSGAQFVYKVVSATPGKWYALSASIKTPSGGDGRFRVQFRSSSNAVVLDRGHTESQPDSDGQKYNLSLQAPAGAETMWVLVWPPENPPLTEFTYFSGVQVAVADSEQAALDQVAEYFDGDTPNVPSRQIGAYEFPFFPVRIGGSVVQGEYELQVEGDAPAYWSGVITPPGEDLLIQNAAGERIFVQGRVDEPILIQTRPQEQDITLADGTPIWDRIDPGDDDFFPLRPGRNRIHVSMVGATQQSEILIRYREAFFHSLGGGR